MRSRLLVLLAAVGVMVGVAPVHAQVSTRPPDGSIGIRLLDAPTNRADDPRAKLYIVDHVSPGTTISRRVEVSNGLDAPLVIPVYAAAATIEDGAFHFGDGREQNELTTWTSVEPSEVVVPTNGAAIATVTIAVPAKASEGERYAVIWAESPTAEPKGGGISAVNRVGVRVYLSVGPGGEPRSDFEIKDLRAQRNKDGEPVIAATVRNTGGRALDLVGEVRLTNGPAGLSAGPFPAEFGGTVGIGAAAQATVRLGKDVPDGPWDVTLKVDSGLVSHEISGRLTFPEAGEAKLASSSRLASNLLIVLVIVIVLALITWRFLLARKRSHDEDGQPA